MPHVLLLGGSGKVAQLLTPMLLRRSWAVTSIIRNPEQVASLQKLAEGESGKLNVRVWSIEEEATSVEKVKELLDEVRPDYVVFSAGAGGKGPPERTYAIDRDAAIYFIRACVARSSFVRKFILISFITSRREKAPWWTAEQWRAAKEGVLTKLARYYDAKVAADQVLCEEAAKQQQSKDNDNNTDKDKGKDEDKGEVALVSLRPGTLTLEEVKGVRLGKIPETTSGNASRKSVAYVTAALLDHPGLKSCWLDMLDGDEDPDHAVNRVVEQGVDCAEGEPYYYVKKE